jgi:hypothetical protein
MADRLCNRLHRRLEEGKSVSTTSNKRQLASGISVIAIAATLSIATPAQAQQTFGTIQGHVEGATAGTQVVAVDTSTGQRGVGTINAQGNYEIFGLRPSTYTVTVPGKPPQTTTVLIGQTSNLDFLAARTASGSIVVTGRRTAQPVQAQTVATNITPAQIENLPQNQRNFLSFAALAPGVQLISPSGAQQVQVGALASSNVNLLLDGMSFKNPINFGGVFGQNFGLGNPFPQIAIQEYQVQTQNFGAETGQAGSAVLTAITKSGGNQFHGSAFIEYQPKSFITQPFFDKKRHVPKPDYKRYQFGGELGGPIIPNKLTFYVAGEGTIYSLPGQTGAITRPLPQNIAALVNITHPNKFKQGLYFGKLTWYATPDDTVNLSAYIRRENNPTDIEAIAADEHGRTILTHQTRFQAQWRHSAGDFLNFLNVAYDKAAQGTTPVTTGPEYILSETAAQDFTTLAKLGGNSSYQNDHQKAWIIKDDATLRHGEHTFKAGAQVTFFSLQRSIVDHFNGTYFVANPGAVATFDIKTAAPYGADINVQATPTTAAKDTQIGVYVQDEWKPDIHWTVNAGIRWDFETNATNKGYVTPPAIAAALRAYPGWAARGIDPEDYISNGHNRKPYWGAFQPRLGVSYDVHGDRDLVFFGGAGRYYDRTLFIQAQNEEFNNSNKIIRVSGAAFAACGGSSPPAYCHDPEALRTLAASQGALGGGVWVLPNKLRMPYSDQFDIGVRKRFGDITATVTLSHIESHHIFMFARANFFENGWFTRFVTRDAAGNVTGCTNGGDAWIWDTVSGGLTNGNGTAVPTSICAAQNALLPGFTGKLNRGLDNGRAHLDAIYLQIEKPFTDQSNWGFTQALTIQRARSNVTQEIIGNEFYNGTAFGVYGWAYVNNVEKWRSVTSANWRAPFGITLSGILTLSSGPAFGHIQAPWNSSIAFPDNSGPNNPSAIIRGNLGGVYFPKYDIGYKRLDLRVAKTFKMPWNHGHELTADFAVFNVFNWLNRTYPSWDAGGGDNPPRTFDGQVANDQREFQVGLKYKF